MLGAPGRVISFTPGEQLLPLQLGGLQLASDHDIVNARARLSIETPTCASVGTPHIDTRRTSVPPARATPTFARTVYRPYISRVQRSK
jgi:hypothetical protein